MVAGVPCMCMRTTGTPARAQSGSIAGSARPGASGPERVWSTGPASRAGGRGPASGRGCSGAPEATVLAPVLPQDLVDLGAIEDLALEQRLGHLVEHLDVASEQQLGVLVGLHDDAPHLGVDLHRGRLRVVDALGEVAAEEDLLLLLAEGDGPELLAHAPLADHLVRELGGALEVVARAGGYVAEHQLLRW